MIGKTLKQLFKALNDYNNATEVLHQEDLEQLELLIYVDDFHVYKGTNYSDFRKVINNEYVKGFFEEIENIVFCGSNRDEFVFLGTTHEIKVYAI